jgi:hypothetical protein
MKTGQPPRDEGLSDEDLAQALLTRVARTAPGAAGAGTPPCERADLALELVEGALGPNEVASYLDHCASCPDCMLALRIARDLHAPSGDARDDADPPSRGPADASHRGAWWLLSRTILHPLAACTYLLALLVTWSLFRAGAPEHAHEATPPASTTSTPRPAVAPLAASRVVRMTGDLAPRGTTSAPAPLQVPMAPDEDLVLELLPDDEGLAAGATVQVRLRSDGELVAESTRVLTGDAQAAGFSVTVDRRVLAPGPTYRVELIAAGATEPAFTQSFVVVRH